MVFKSCETQPRTELGLDVIPTIADDLSQYDPLEIENGALEPKSAFTKTFNNVTINITSINTK